MPYGNKNKFTIIKYANQNIRFLESCGVKAVLAACGTASSYLQNVNSKVECLGVIEPACLAALKAARTEKVGVLGTKTAVSSNSYSKCLKALNNKVKCLQQACPLLVPIIEAGHISTQNSILNTVLDFYVSPLLCENIDTIILGCTHYPLIESAIKEIFRKDLNLINSGKEAAQALKKFLRNKNLCSKSQENGKIKFYSSGDEKKFADNIKLFLGEDFKYEVKKIDIEKF